MVSWLSDLVKCLILLFRIHYHQQQAPSSEEASTGGGGIRDLGIADDISYHSYKKSIIDEYNTTNKNPNHHNKNTYHQFVARDKNGPIHRHQNTNDNDEDDDELLISDEKKIEESYSYENDHRFPTNRSDSILTYNTNLETTTTTNSSELTKLRLHLDKYTHDTFSNVTDLLTNNAVIQKLELHRSSSPAMLNTMYNHTTTSSPHSGSSKRKSSSRKNKIKKIIMMGNGSSSSGPPSVYDHHSLEDLELHQERERYHRTVEEIRWLCSIVRDLPRLQELHLWNFHCGVVSQGSSRNSTSNQQRGLAAASHNKVEIPIDEYEIQQEMYALCDLLYEHPTLRKVHLGVSCGRIPDDLLKALGTIPNLIRVELQLHESCGLANLIRKSRTLQELIVHTSEPKHISSDDRNKDVRSGDFVSGSFWQNNPNSSDPFEYSSEHSLSMMQALETNTRLRYLDLGNNAYLSSFGVRVMGYALRENKTLRTLKYSFNSDSVSSVQQRIDIASKTLKELCQVMELHGVELHTFVNHTSHNVLVTNDTIAAMVQALSKNDSIEEFAFFDETPDVTARKNMAIKRRIREEVPDSSNGPLLGRMACM